MAMFNCANCKLYAKNYMYMHKIEQMTTSAIRHSLEQRQLQLDCSD